MSVSDFNPHDDVAALLRWHLDAGVDETIADAPVDRYAVVAKPAAAPEVRSPAVPLLQAVAARAAAPPVALKPEFKSAPASSAHLAQDCKTLDELKEAIAKYEGCALKTFATRTVFGDGNPNARVLVIGEAPGEDEDRQGKPFVGVSGKLLDAMLGSVGLSRDTNVFITNIVFWRPPGNRKPTAEEVVQCMPFVQRIIEIMDPAQLLVVGGASASAILANAQGITKLRGKWFDFESPGLSRPVPVMATFHPAYLLRSPNQKRLAWRDLLVFKQKLDSSPA